MKHTFALFVVCLALGAFGSPPVPAPESRATVSNLAYYSDKELKKADAYRREQCRLDLRYPTNRTGFATVVWFHGGGLTEGRRHFPALPDPQLALVAAGYRLSPKATLPSFIEDAAAATAWVVAHIAEYGGDSNKVFVAGHSAGGYLTAMIGMDPRWLAARGLSNLQLAGLIPVSAQVTTHFHVKKLRGDLGQQYRPLIDEYAPLYYCASNLPPLCLITGDRALEFKCRVEENDFMAASLRTLGHPRVEFHEVKGFDHGAIGTGAMARAHAFIQSLLSPPAPGAQAPLTDPSP